MKYYCESCGMEFADEDCFAYPIDLGKDETCPVCEGFGLIEIPAYETVAAWEKRKGRKYPDTAPVYLWDVISESWELKEARCRRYFMPSVLIVATEAGAPPDDWRPE